MDAYSTRVVSWLNVLSQFNQFCSSNVIYIFAYADPQLSGQFCPVPASSDN